MYAIVDVGGRQYNVAVGDVVFLEKLGVKENEKFRFDRVVALVEENNSSFGAPFLDGVSVEGLVLKNAKRKKIRVFKYKRRKNYSRRYGHRQQYTKLEITAINK